MTKYKMEISFKLIIIMDGKIEQVKTIGIELKAFDILAKDSDYISVTEWSNGEGWDIYIGDGHIGLTLGQLKAINFLTTAIDYNFNITKNEH